VLILDPVRGDSVLQGLPDTVERPRARCNAIVNREAIDPRRRGATPGSYPRFAQVFWIDCRPMSRWSSGSRPGRAPLAPSTRRPPVSMAKACGKQIRELMLESGADPRAIRVGDDAGLLEPRRPRGPGKQPMAVVEIRMANVDVFSCSSCKRRATVGRATVYRIGEQASQA
jgi:hypothetical protein